MANSLVDTLLAAGWRDDESMPFYEGDITLTPPDKIDDSGLILLIVSTVDHETDDGLHVPAGRVTLQREQPEQPAPDNIVFRFWDDHALVPAGLAEEGLA